MRESVGIVADPIAVRVDGLGRIAREGVAVIRHPGAVRVHGLRVANLGATRVHGLRRLFLVRLLRLGDRRGSAPIATATARREREGASDDQRA